MNSKKPNPNIRRKATVIILIKNLKLINDLNANIILKYINNENPIPPIKEVKKP
jgi:hypothetical protein